VTTAYLGLGTNLGDRAAQLDAALAALRADPGVTAVEPSPVYETDPVGPAGQPAYLNQAAAVETALGARALLTLMQSIERAAGRDRQAETRRWGPRVLDLDLLLYGDGVIDEPGLRVPHPHLHERWFVLRPLTDLAPDVVHPVLGRRVRDLLAGLEPAGRRVDG